MSEDSRHIPLQWAWDLVAKKAYVLHVPTRVIGQAIAFHESTEDRKGAVLEITPGHTFFARKESFLELSAMQMAYYETVQTVLRNAISATVQLGGETHIPLPMIMTFVIAGLQAQLAALQATG